MKVLGLIGLPGSGKTTALENLEERIDVEFKGMKMKDIASDEFMKMKENGLKSFPEEFQSKVRSREMVDEVVVDGDIGNEIADWVDSVLEIQEDYFATIAAERVREYTSPDVLVVDGIRSVSDVECIQQASDTFHLVYLQCPFHVRLQRLKNRSRQGEENIDAEYLMKRDEQELSWGVHEILSSYDKGYSEYEKVYPIEYFYSSHNSVPEFMTEFSFFIDSLLEI